MRPAFAPGRSLQYVILMARNVRQRDFYDVLGVARDADTKTIQKTFHEHARRCHPDVALDPSAVERFRDLSQAYEVLSDPRARLLYDRLAYRGPGGGGFGPVHPGVGRPTKENAHVSDYELLAWIFGGDAPDEPPLRPRDDPLVLGLAAVAFVTALVVAAALALG